MKLKMPDKKFLGGFAAGLLWGAVIAFLGGVLYLRHSLLDERECVAGFDTVVKEIPARAAKLEGWTVQRVVCTLPKFPDGTRMAAFRLCQPDYALKLTGAESDRKTSCVIPCTFAIYEKSDGKTYIARMDVSLLGRLLGGEPSRVFPKKVSPEHEFILQGLVK